MYAHFKSYIKDRAPLQASDWERIQKVFQPRQLAAGEHILEEGQICHNLYFLDRGLLRYYNWIDGMDRTKFFTFQSQLFTSQGSFSDALPSTENIQAIETSQVLYTDRQTAQRLFKEIPAWATFVRSIIIDVQVWTSDLLLESLHQTAEQRYLNILQQKPEWIQRIPLKYLASYLGIAPESLSRIRRKLQTQQRANLT